MNQAALDNMEARRSCRAFFPDMPKREQIEAVCRAGLYAPSGHNKQGTVIVAITKRELRDRLSAMNAKIWNELSVSRGSKPKGDIDPFYGAPVLLLVLSDKEVRTWLYDGCAVMTNMANAATAVGLASCWVHRGEEEFACDEGRAILREIGLDPDRYVGIDQLAVGLPAKELPPALPRKEGRVMWVE